MKKFNKYTQIGLVFNSIFLLINPIDSLSHFFKGLFLAFGLTFIFLGMYSENHDISKLKNFKKNLFNKVFAK